jgi:starch-binding outer membrane protein, SusD/RagB family
MKKYFLLLFISALAFTGCDESLLDIDQKGVLSADDFYKTDADATAALVGVYFDSFKNFAKADAEYNYGPLFGLTNFQADDMYLAGSGSDDCVSQREYQQFRYGNDNSVPLQAYTAFYRSIHKCNLVITNFTEAKLGSPLTATMKQCVAEARVMRAYDHMMLGIYWGKPPIVEEVLTGSSRPKNADSQEAVMDWVAKEIDLALPDLTERQGPNDQAGAVRITKGFAYAVKGKALIWKEDYIGAKAALKEVINSGNYGLVPSADMIRIGHADGKATKEAVFEFNITTDPAVVSSNSVSLRTGWNDHKTFNWRFENMNGGNLNDAQINNNGWGWMNPTGKFAEDLIANDGMESARRKAWIKTYDEILYNHQWVSDGTTFVAGRTAAKETDLTRGIGSGKYIYGNEGYFIWKIVVHKDQGDINKVNDGWDRNLSLMRYAEVLLLYAEACAQSGTDEDGLGLKSLNDIQIRAESKHVSTALTLAEVQQEKQFELYLEGSRSADLIRWGKTESLEKQGYYVPNLRDELPEGKGTKHKGYVDASAATFYKDKYGDNIGFKKGKHEVLPFPKNATDLNDNLKQNDNWD